MKRNKHRKPTPQASTPHKPRQEVVSNVPAQLINEGRKQSHYIIDTLAKTATHLASGEGAGDKVAIIERLWAMQKDAEDRQSEREFGIAKVALAMQLPTIPKTKSIDFIDKNNQRQTREYSDRSDIESVLDPICRHHGFSKEYSTKTVDGKACQILTVRHVGGHKEVYESPYMPLDTTGSKNNNQAAGSTAEYGKRYALIGAFNIIGVDKDDDGNLGKDTEDKADKFTQRVQEEAKAAEEKPPVMGVKEKMPALEAAQLLEAKLRNTKDLEARGKILMKNTAILGALMSEGQETRANALRALAEGKDEPAGE